jgi:hypothetical protein
MEISPIPGIRPLTAVKAPPAESQLTAVFDIDLITKMGDGASSASLRKAAGVDEEENDDMGLGSESSLDSHDGGPKSSISFFA